MSEFMAFPKIARFSREIVVTEKIDGTNGQVFIRPGDGSSEDFAFGFDTQVEIDGVSHLMRAGSKNRWLTTTDDNYGFARWVYQNAHTLANLGPGRHFGEWWGQGIQRNYGLREKRFSLFNVRKWTDTCPACCHVVPVLARFVAADGLNTEPLMRDLLDNGSRASPGYMNPEGIIIFHAASNTLFKKTFDGDAEGKDRAIAA